MSNARLYDRLFRSPEAVAVFSDDAQLSAMLQVEAALARAEGRLGVIPQDAASVIVRHCSVEVLDIERLVADSAAAGNLAIPLVKQLTASVRKESPEAAGYVHWGATSQDIIDTAFVLLLCKQLQLIEAGIDDLMSACASLASAQADTVIAGRTWLQQAVPVTFGLKAATWLDVLLRHKRRLTQLKDRALVVQFGGAAGTLASLAGRGREVASALGADLQLGSPSLPWHASRDRIAEIAGFHGLLAGSLGKIGRDISLCMQTEVGELSEALAPGAGASSTMPHKRNPVSCAVLLAAATRAPGLVATVLSAMVQEHERGLGGWQAEWETLPELCTLTLGALQRAGTLVSGLHVDANAMRRNLAISNRLPLAEAVSMRLAESVGRDRAHALVEEASHRALDQRIPFLDALLHSPHIAQHLGPAALRDLLEPEHYLGSAQEFIDKVLQDHQALTNESDQRCHSSKPME